MNAPTVQQMKDALLREFGDPVAGIRKGGVIARLTVLGWSDLYAEEALELAGAVATCKCEAK